MLDAVFSNPEHTQIQQGNKIIPVDMASRGYRLLVENNVPIGDYVAPPVYASAEVATAAMVSWIDEITLSITGNYPIDEKLAWPRKEAAALAYIANTATYTQTDMLQSEANLTGDTVAELALIVKAKAEAYNHIIGLVSGLRRNTETAIAVEAAKDDPDAYQYEVILLQAKLDAVSLLSDI